VRDLCRRYGTLFIADEVASGFGRTGRLFACEHFDLAPDMMCVAKAMSGGLAPIGAVIATAPIAKSMEENDGTFYSTYGWHPRSVAAAIATLRGLKASRARLLAGVAEMSEYFRVRLLQLEFDQPAAVRIQGLAIGIDVGDEDYADAIHDKCRRNGLLVSTEGSTVLLLPSLAIDKRTATKGWTSWRARSDAPRRRGDEIRMHYSPLVSWVCGRPPRRTHAPYRGAPRSLHAVPRYGDGCAEARRP
jgi:acetylornithine/succinyldiaminopimelate/putrescine aminotransferase